MDAPATPPRGDPLDLLAELLGRGLPVTIKARGGSMRPALRDGDVLTVAPLPGHARVGEVVAARRGSQLSLHRVREVQAGRVRLCGDACAHDDGFFEPSELLGRAVAVRREGRPLAPARLGGAVGRLLGLLRPLTRAGLRAERLMR